MPENDSDSSRSATDSVKAREPTSKRKKRKFNAQLPFSPFPPYTDLFAERVPLVVAFTQALSTCLSYPNKDETTFNAAECGVYTGNSLLACAQLAEHYGINVSFTGLDTFEGLPQLGEMDLKLAPENAPYRDKRLFDDTSRESVQTKLTDAGFQNVVLKQGLFSQTLKELPDQKYFFVNVDCDLYEPHLQCLEYFYPRLIPGAVLYFDDFHSAHYPMAKQAIRDFLKDKPERLLHLRFGKLKRNHTKTFLIKYPG